MIETSNPEIDVKALMARIQEEVAGYGLELPASRRRGRARLSMVEFPRLRAKRRLVAGKKLYRLDELLVFYDEPFIENAYAVLLQRKPDRDGKQNYLAQLREGRINRVEVLGRLRWSSEGRNHDIAVAGLAGAFAKRMVFRIPLLGFLLEYVTVLVRLPARLRHMIFIQEQTIARLDEMERQLNLLAQQSESSVNRLIEELNRDQ